MRKEFTGVGTALVTPFTKSGALDEAAVRKLARRQVDAGIHFLVPCGTTGETPTLSAAERRKIVEICVEEARGRALVLAGAGGYDTREVAHAAVSVPAGSAESARDCAAKRGAGLNENGIERQVLAVRGQRGFDLSDRRAGKRGEHAFVRRVLDETVESGKFQSRESIVWR